MGLLRIKAPISPRVKGVVSVPDGLIFGQREIEGRCSSRYIATTEFILVWF